MDSIFSRIGQAISGPSQAPAEKKPSKQGFFSALFGGRRSSEEALAFSFDAYLAGLEARAPRLSAGTMDGSGDGGGSSVKSAYRRSSEAVPEALVEWYASHRFIGWQLCAILAQHWLINKACSVPVEDALRHGFNIVSDTGNLDEEELGKLKISLRDHDVHRKLSRFLRKGRIFGLMIAIFHVESDDPDYYKHPFNQDAVTPGSYRGITLVEPYWCAPQPATDDIGNPASPDFYTPTWWKIGDRLYHRSHLAIFRQDEVPDILKPSYFYGGIPIPQKILSRVYAAERTADEAPALAMSKRTTILKTDSEKALANYDEFMEKLGAWLRLRDNFAVKVIDKENEDLNQVDTTLTDFDAVMMGQYQLVAAAADVPATKLLGTSPKGFNATGEYEESSYHETLESLQEEHGTPFLEKHLLLSARSAGIRTDDLVLTVAWKPVDSPSGKEYAEIRKMLMEHDVSAVEAGILMPEQVAQRLYDDENSGFTKPEASGGQALEEMFGELSRMADQLTARQATVDAEESDLEEVFGVLEELAEDLSGAQDMVDANGQEHDDLGRFGEGVGEKKFGGRSEKIKLTDFVSSAVKNTSEQKTLLLTEGVSGKTRNRIKDKTGIDIGDARVQLRSDNVRHSNKEHPDLTSSDWKKLAYMIENFDDVKAMREKGSNSEDRLGFTMVDKKTGYGYVADVRISRNKGKRLSVVTFFKDHPKSVANWFENG